jgi:murein DD-endopeptidase MepM/ murein hydrolase activator NlpD
MKRKMIYGFTAALSLTAITLGPVTSYASKLSNAQAKYSQLAQSQKSTQAKIASLKQQEASIQDQLAKIQAQVSNLDRSIISTQADIQRRNNQITQLQQEITKTQQQIQIQYGVLTQRVRLMYEAGQSSYLQVLFSSTSFSDLLDRLQLLSMIAQQDRAVLNGIQTNKQHLDQAKSQVQNQLVQVKAAYDQLLTQKNQEKSAQNQEMGLLAQVHSAKLNEQAALKSENSAMQNLKSLIQQLEASEGGYHGAATGWTWPVPGHFRITSPYGWRTWSDGTREFHNGIDIGAPLGAPIVAATSGKVLYAGPATGFGDWIVIESGGGLMEVYGHMYSYEIKVHPGEIVHTGQQIAGVGSNGFSTGPHLHFTVATGFDSSGFPISVNPTKYVH